jgi:hypothetical protein
MVEFDARGTDHFGDPALRDPTQNFHLRPAEVGMDYPDRRGQVPVVLGVDKGYLMLVPTDGDGILQWQPLRRQACEAFVQ